MRLVAAAVGIAQPGAGAMTDAVIDNDLDDKHFLAAAMAVVRRRRAWREAHQKASSPPP